MSKLHSTLKNGCWTFLQEEDNILDSDQHLDEQIKDATEYSCDNGFVGEDLDDMIWDAVDGDKKELFLTVLNDLTHEQVVRWDPFNFIFECDSVNCVNAMLNGESAGKCEINNVNAVPFTRNNRQLVPILHKAARQGAYKITKLCLPGNEAQVNLRIDEADGMKGVLPLNLALHRILLFDILLDSDEDDDPGSDEEDDPHHRASDKAIMNESKQASTRWFVNKRNMLSLSALYCGHLDPSPLRLYHTYHFMRRRPGFSSTMANKFGRSRFSCQSFQQTYHSGRSSDGLGSFTSDKANNGVMSGLQLKKQCQDSGQSARRRTGVCSSWASNLQFNRECALSAHSSRWILINYSSSGPCTLKIKKLVVWPT
ncbi:OLC1v1037679C1 [Oldenlandia corymbosa var. corymbosa]|uniref:OLC1v1037679C1 n=1 Tax=Oldenlandia corymbosa var. corymbosa TaxID=529605 RepID=A0AAV1CZ53_OLDCO|nr:OLC1v1037679C1 [Oldenlandia corymbosa var. corymbosa]